MYNFSYSVAYNSQVTFTHAMIMKRCKSSKVDAKQNEFSAQWRKCGVIFYDNKSSTPHSQHIRSQMC